MSIVEPESSEEEIKRVPGASMEPGFEIWRDCRAWTDAGVDENTLDYTGGSKSGHSEKAGSVMCFRLSIISQMKECRGVWRVRR